MSTTTNAALANVHDELKKALRGRIEQILRTVPVENGAPSITGIFAEKDKFQRGLGKVHEDLVDGEAVCLLIYELIRGSVEARFTEEQASEMDGKPVSSQEAIREITTEVVDFIATIPRNSLTLVPIHSISQLGEGYFELPDGFCLLKSPRSAERIDDFPEYLRAPLLKSLTPLSQFLPSNEPAITSGTYLGRHTLGIPTFLSGRETAHRAFDDIKVWMGIGRRLYHFSVLDKGLLRSMAPPNQRAGYLVDTTTNNLSTVLLSHDDSHYLSRLTLDFEDGDVARYREVFSNVVAPFFDGENLTPCAAAYQWLFDSYAASNDTNAFLYCCFGLEAALGEEGNEDGITKLLAERCAYLLGDTNKERATLRTEFREIYKMRSRLVHGRDRRINSAVNSVLYSARNLLEKIAFAEWSKVRKHTARAKSALQPVI